MKKRKELRAENQGIRAYVKYPSLLKVKRPSKATYTPYAEYWIKLIRKD